MRALFVVVLLVVCISCLALRSPLRSTSRVSKSRLHDIVPIISSVTDQLDPTTGQFVAQTLDQSIQAFMGSFSSRIVGTLIGNLVAGVFFKFLADNVFFRKKEEEQKPQESKAKVESKPALPEISQAAWLKLVLCVGIDLISDSSFLLPGVGELEDVAWAPISALLMKNIFNSNNVGTAEFVKEILPFTDVIPLATALWFFENVLPDSPVNKILGLNAQNDKEKDRKKEEMK